MNNKNEPFSPVKPVSPVVPNIYFCIEKLLNKEILKSLIVISKLPLSPVKPVGPISPVVPREKFS